MLTATFIHAEGVGSATEQSLWQQGATSWEAFAANPHAWKLPPRLREVVPAMVDQSLAALADRRIDWFARRLPRREHWRAASAFPKLGFLDIETDGGKNPHAITLIGLGDGHDTQIYVKGRDLARFAYEAQDFDGFVTFFGTSFDLPFLIRRFPVMENVFADRLHIDLCPLLKRLGHTGGLKRIEHALGIVRVPETEGLSGWDAVRLWRIFERGGVQSDDALRLLLAYNREDVENMKTLLDYALPRLRARAGAPSLLLPAPDSLAPA